jgi:rubrerythrin
MEQKYKYECDECGFTWPSDDEETECPECGSDFLFQHENTEER